MNKLVLIFAAALCASASNAGPGVIADHLEPVMSATQAAATGNREADVELTLFKEAFGSNVRARARLYVLPGGYENMMFITENDGEFRLVDLFVARGIDWYAYPPIQRLSGPAIPQPDAHKANVVRSETAISPDLAKAIISDWKRLLLKTRYETGHRIGMDGIRLVLSMEDETGAYAGEAWDPYEFPTLAAMSAVAQDMIMYCEVGATTTGECVVPDLKLLPHDLEELTKELDASKLP